MKIWGGSGRKPGRSAAAPRQEEKKPQAEPKGRNIIDFETLLEWYKENNLEEAVGNEREEPRAFVQKPKSIRFLSL